jgi:hypothetical protein
MSLYKRFRGHEPSPEALKESGTTINHNEFLFQNRGSNVSVFLSKENDHQPPKNRNAFDPKGSSWIFSLAKNKNVRAKTKTKFTINCSSIKLV